MSRNLGQRNCYFCPSPVVLKEAERPVNEKDVGGYYTEYEGMLVADAECPACLAQYLAWVTGPKGSNWNNLPREEGQTHVDLSFRSTFNDEPGERDLPRYKVVSKLFRIGAFTESDSNYFRLGEVQELDRLAGTRPNCSYPRCANKALKKSSSSEGDHYYAGCTTHYSLPGMQGALPLCGVTVCFKPHGHKGQHGAREE